MENVLSGLLDQVLGRGDKSSQTNRKYVCPFPECDSHARGSKKLEIDIVTDKNGYNKHACWVCGYRGRTIYSLFKKMKVPSRVMDSLSKVIVISDVEKEEAEKFNGILPREYVFLLEADPNNNSAKQASAYLKSRGITKTDVIKYQIGYCEYGEYRDRIIVPSYDDLGSINFFISRTYNSKESQKYKFPQVSRDIIPFDMYINWDLPVVLCEGIFDMFAIKRNVVPILGKSITPSLMKKLISSNTKKIYIALDNDAIKMALKHCETFLSYGKKVYLVSTDKKDASEAGFDEFLKQIQTTPELTQERLLKLKLSKA
jgi:hypothetical protein